MATDELKYTNALVGFFIPAGHWPCPFQESEYELIGVQLELLATWNGLVRRVVPEVMCASLSDQHVIIIDVKSTRISSPQATAYGAISGPTLVEQGRLVAGFDRDRTTPDVMFVTANANADVLIRRIRLWNLTLPTVVHTNGQFRKSGGSFRSQKVDEIFDRGITIESDADWPLHFVPVSSASDDGELAPFVMAAVSRSLLVGAPFTALSIAEDSIDYWRWCGD